MQAVMQVSDKLNGLVTNDAMQVSDENNIRNMIASIAAESCVMMAAIASAAAIELLLWYGIHGISHLF